MAMLRVMHIIGGGEFGGAEEHLVHLLQQCKQRGLIPQLVCFYDSLLAKRVRELEIGVDVLAYRRFDSRLLKKLIQLMGQKKPNLIHTHGVKANFFGRLAAKYTAVKQRTNIPVITTVHSLLHFDYKHPLARCVASFMEKSTRRWTDHFIAISKAIKKQLLADGIPARHIQIIHHGIDVQRFSPQAKGSTHTLAKKWGKTESNHLIGAVGRLEEVKGFHYFIEACSLLHLQQAKQYRFVIVGEGSERRRLENLVHKKQLSEHFTFAGFRDDVTTCYPAFDCYVNSSLSEGLGLAVIEAMSTGLPIVATKVGGILDIAQHEKNALLVEPQNPKQLVEAIQRVIGDQQLAQRLSKQAREDVVTHFSVQQMGDKTIKQYLKWLGRENDVR